MRDGLAEAATGGPFAPREGDPQSDPFGRRNGFPGSWRGWLPPALPPPRATAPSRGAGGQGRSGLRGTGLPLSPAPGGQGGCEEVWGTPSLGPSELLGLCLGVPRWQVGVAGGEPRGCSGVSELRPGGQRVPGPSVGDGGEAGLQLPLDSPRRLTPRAQSEPSPGPRGRPWVPAALPAAVLNATMASPLPSAETGQESAAWPEISVSSGPGNRK